MFAMKTIVVLSTLVAVVFALNATTNSNVVETLMAAKINRTSSTNSSASSNDTSPTASTVKDLVKRSVEFNKAAKRFVCNVLLPLVFFVNCIFDFFSEVVDAWWRIPTLLCQFISETFLAPLMTSFHQLAEWTGLHRLMNNTAQIFSSDFIQSKMPHYQWPSTPSTA